MNRKQTKRTASLQGILVVATSVVALILLWSVTSDMVDDNVKWVLSIVFCTVVLLALSGICDYIANKYK